MATRIYTVPIGTVVCEWILMTYLSSSSGLTKCSQIGAGHPGVKYLARVFVDSTQIHMGGISAMLAYVLVKICAAAELFTLAFVHQ